MPKYMLIIFLDQTTTQVIIQSEKKCFESKEGILSFGWSKFHLSSDPVENGSLDLQISSAAADPAIIDPNGK